MFLIFAIYQNPKGINKLKILQFNDNLEKDYCQLDFDT